MDTMDFAFHKNHEKNKQCTRASLLIKLQASDLQFYLKKDSGTGV